MPRIQLLLALVNITLSHCAQYYDGFLSYANSAIGTIRAFKGRPPTDTIGFLSAVILFVSIRAVNLLGNTMPDLIFKLTRSIASGFGDLVVIKALVVVAGRGTGCKRFGL